MTEHQTGGHGRPPAHHQFGQGQKRAAGRPRGAIGEKAIVQRIAGELHKIQQNGQSIEVNTIELLLISMATWRWAVIFTPRMAKRLPRQDYP